MNEGNTGDDGDDGGDGGGYDGGGFNSLSDSASGEEIFAELLNESTASNSSTKEQRDKAES